MSATSINEPVDTLALRRTLGAYATGVTIITARGPDGDRVGMTMNSFASVSLDPPLLLFSVARTARSLAAFRKAEGYAIHVLGADQELLSSRFARADSDKWANLSCGEGHGGAPLLEGVLARFECVPHAIHDGGDHEIFVVKVVAFSRTGTGQPLLFYDGRYASIADNGTVG